MSTRFWLEKIARGIFFAASNYILPKKKKKEKRYQHERQEFV